MAGHQRTTETPADGGRADTPAGGGRAGAMLRMGIDARAMGEGRMRREPKRAVEAGRKDAPAVLCNGHSPKEKIVRSSAL
jgi:hypothetical protein